MLISLDLRETEELGKCIINWSFAIKEGREMGQLAGEKQGHILACLQAA